MRPSNNEQVQEASVFNQWMQSSEMISDHDFKRFSQLLYSIAGIELKLIKKALLISRLQKRVTHYQLSSWADYYQLVTNNNQEELQVMVDLLTTNETYFFREPAHFEYLQQQLLPQYKNKPIKVWSAASSTGEEIYSLAMLLSDCLPHDKWSILGSDINSQVIQKARQGHYLDNRIEGIPQSYLQKFCLKGVRQQAGTILMTEQLKQKTHFMQINLKQALPDIGTFDLILMRNVLIYFDKSTKEQIVNRVSRALKPGGLLIISHSENLHGICENLTMVIPSIFRKEPKNVSKHS